MLLLDELADQPVSFFLCFATISILVGEAVAKRQLDWAIPSLVAYATVGAWYLIEPFYLPEGFTKFFERHFGCRLSSGDRFSPNI